MEPSYFGVIPATVRYDNDLQPAAKLLYSEITCLCTKEGYCWATNRYFGDLYGVHPDTVSLWISRLKRNGHVDYKMVETEKPGVLQRRMWPLIKPPKDLDKSPANPPPDTKRPHRKNSATPPKKRSTPTEEIQPGVGENSVGVLKKFSALNKTTNNTSVNRGIEQERSDELTSSPEGTLNAGETAVFTVNPVVGGDGNGANGVGISPGSLTVLPTTATATVAVPHHGPSAADLIEAMMGQKGFDQQPAPVAPVIEAQEAPEPKGNIATPKRLNYLRGVMLDPTSASWKYIEDVHRISREWYVRLVNGFFDGKIAELEGQTPGGKQMEIEDKVQHCKYFIATQVPLGEKSIYHPSRWANHDKLKSFQETGQLPAGYSSFYAD